ncbi:MAG: GatB/YqeY domain-containing protein [Pseudomonadota bacterium]
MSLADTLKNDMKDAMRAKDKERLGVIRMLLAAIKQVEVDKRITLDDTQILSVVEKLVKQRRESIKQFNAGNRPELAKKEEEEIAVLARYLPEQLNEAELVEIIDGAIAQTQAASMQDMGKVMGVVKARVAGRADMGAASAKIKALLSDN